MKADLHIHTIASDGSCSCEQIVKKAIENSIEFIAIADHDTVNGVDDFMKAAKQNNLIAMPAIEFSVEYTKPLHILGYLIDIENNELKKKLDKLEQDRIDRVYKIIDMLKGKGLELSFDEVKSNYTSKSIGRVHIAKAMVRKGYVDNISEAFDKYISADKIKEVERERIDAKSCIELITKAGGVSVLAHPSFMYDENFDHYVNELISYGLNGLEVYCPDNTDEHTRIFEKICVDKGMLATCGSDYHGSAKKHLDVGCENRSSEYLEYCLKLLYNKSKERFF